MTGSIRGFLEEITHSSKEMKDSIHEFMYYISLLLLVLTNFAAVFMLLPVFLFLKGFELYAILILFSILLGFLFNTLLHAMHHLGEKHHVIATVLVPAMALFDMIVLIRALDKMSLVLGVPLQYNPLSVILTFIVIFLMPYFFDLFRGKHVVTF